MSEFDVYDGIENAKDVFAKNYLEKGNFDLRIISVKSDKSRKNVYFFAVDMDVVQSDNPKYAPGDRVNFITTADKDGFHSNVKNFILAALTKPNEPRIDPASVTKEVVAMVCQDAGAAVSGNMIHCQVIPKPTKNGGTFSLHIFGPYGTDSAEE